jgi:hypothetical protein
MKNDADELSGDQFYNAFIVIEADIYGEQDLVPWDAPENYKLEDLRLEVV